MKDRERRKLLICKKTPTEKGIERGKDKDTRREATQTKAYDTNSPFLDQFFFLLRSVQAMPISQTLLPAGFP